MRKALAVLKKNKKIIYCKGYSNYATISTYKALLNVCKKPNHSVFELIFADKPVPLFFNLLAFDIERKHAMSLFATFNEQLNSCFTEYEKQIYILESHRVVGNVFKIYSLHVVCRFFDKHTSNEVLFENVLTLGRYVKEFFNSELIDPAVYREGLFLCIYSGEPRIFSKVFKPVCNYKDETQLFILNHKTEFQLISFTGFIKQDEAEDKYTLELFDLRTHDDVSENGALSLKKKPFFDTKKLLQIVCKAAASNLCEVEDAVIHNISSSGHIVDTKNDVVDLGTDFPLHNDSFENQTNSRPVLPCNQKLIFYKVASFNDEQQCAFNEWLRLPASCLFFLFFKTLPYVSNYTISYNQVYRFNGTIWTQSRIKEQFSDDTLNILNYILANTTQYKDDNFLWPFLKKQFKTLTEIAGNNQFPMLKKLKSLEKQNIQFDSNHNILPFTNGVYDLTLKCFRCHEPSDYITKTLTFAYDKTIKSSALDLFLEQIMTVAEERDYLLYTLATLLYSDTSNDHMYFFIGKGCNGKSLLLRLVQLTLGPFAKKLSTNMFTTHALTSSQARPELLELKNCKVAILTDPRNNTMCSSTVKNLAGNETLVARGLYSKTQETFSVSAKFIISMNTFPTFTENDQATRRRLRFIMFHSSFVPEPKEDLEFLIDEKLGAQIINDVTWVQAFINKLLAIDVSKHVVVPDSFKKDLVYLGNGDLNSFLLDNLKQKIGSFITAKEIIYAFTDESLHTKSKKYKQHYVTIHNFITITFPLSKLVKKTVNGQVLRGWPGLYLASLD